MVGWVLAIGRLVTANTECGVFLTSGRCCGSSHLGGQGHSSAHSGSVHWRSGGQDSGDHHPVWA